MDAATYVRNLPGSIAYNPTTTQRNSSIQLMAPRSYFPWPTQQVAVAVAVAPSVKITSTAALQARVRSLCTTMPTSHIAPFCTNLKKKKITTDSDILAEALIWSFPKKSEAKTKKITIPKHVKTLVWNKYIGSDKAEAPCISCRSQIISIRNFHCGHVIAEANGGDSNINNLRPICAPCNLSMGKRSMNDFTQGFFGWSV
jgi:hypothetical protein